MATQFVVRAVQVQRQRSAPNVLAGISQPQPNEALQGQFSIHVRATRSKNNNVTTNYSTVFVVWKLLVCKLLNNIRLVGRSKFAYRNLVSCRCSEHLDLKRYRPRKLCSAVLGYDATGNVDHRRPAADLHRMMPQHRMPQYRTSVPYRKTLLCMTLGHRTRGTGSIDPHSCNPWNNTHRVGRSMLACCTRAYGTHRSRLLCPLPCPLAPKRDLATLMDPKIPQTLKSCTPSSSTRWVGRSTWASHNQPSNSKNHHQVVVGQGTSCRFQRPRHPEQSSQCPSTSFLLCRS